MDGSIIQLAKPFIPKEAIEQVAHVLESGHLIQGRWVEEFESALAAGLGIKHVVLVSSGTAALHLSLAGLGIHRGDEILVPAFTFPATANVVELLGATPRLVDIGLGDFCIDPERIDKEITSRTKAIIPVHEFGQSADLERILEIARRRGLPVVEDAACALGTECAGRKAGTWGEIGCFSFHPRKTITTGEGGAVVTDDPEMAARIRSLRNHGMATRGGVPDFRYAGFNYRMTDLQAALGKVQLPYLHGMIKRRREIAEQYGRELASLPWITVPCEIEGRPHSFQTYHLLVGEGVERDKLREHLRHHGIESNIGAYALHCLSFFKEKYGYRESDFPKAVTAYRRGLALPMGSHIADEDVTRVVEAILRFHP